ncbi:hypothetical protein C1H46_017504 [Malus baccata]|uniref:Peroxiredoxin n=1 Tax=Malus baccata TaxID=106549 RepID=A0A540MEQ5_MALBA|nr:hypothetical protein C1H46_017504 [Malus baccata]
MGPIFRLLATWCGVDESAVTTACFLVLCDNEFRRQCKSGGFIGFLGDFTPVCTTELRKMAKYSRKFQEKGVKFVGLSCDDLPSYLRYGSAKKRPMREPYFLSKVKLWLPLKKWIEKFGGGGRDFCNWLCHPNQLREVASVPSQAFVPSRVLQIGGPDKKVKLSFLYPASTGRNMEEVMRVLESLQKANKHKVATLTNWKWGDPVVISPSVSQDEANKMFPPSYKTVYLPSKKKYLRFTNV